jgi:hypothetical protein
MAPVRANSSTRRRRMDMKFAATSASTNGSGETGFVDTGKPDRWIRDIALAVLWIASSCGRPNTAPRHHAAVIREGDSRAASSRSTRPEVWALIAFDVSAPGGANRQYRFITSRS